ncbi:permease family protein [bacterium BMS3Abin05]|nr:permease family protein [bacterium BMS3Abin05]
MIKKLNRAENRFTLSEWSGAVGDLGTLLPLAFALVIFNGYSSQRLFFLWGIVYLISGWYYRVPVAVQPLKAMAVIAFAGGYSVGQLSTTAVFYGILLIVLAGTGVIRWLERWFTPALVRGIQLGIGFILLQKAVEMSLKNGLFLGYQPVSRGLNFLLLFALLLVLGIFQFQKNKPISVGIIFISIALSLAFGISTPESWSQGNIAVFSSPDWRFFLPAVMFLMIPQLPLTLGNAVFAANDACHTFWKERSERVTPTRFGVSIGISNVVIGLLGGFPICHGAGGIAAHAKFGGKTGGTTMILGGILILVSLVKPLSNFLFLIPIPVLGALLLLTSWSLIVLIQRLQTKSEILIALIVGLLSFSTHNLSIALIAGFLLEQGLIRAAKWRVALKGENHD